MVIRILDHVENCVSYEDGDTIYRLMLDPLTRGEDVVLSFDGVDAVPSSFVNGSILRLAETVSMECIRAHVRVVNSTKQINELIRSRVAFVDRTARPAVFGAPTAAV